MGSGHGALFDFDPEVARAVYDETRRQAGGLELIASENFVSEAVLEAAGSVLTNKYAEGYPGKRYYGGCEFVDVVERLAQDRARRLFGADHANVQPHSGSGANMAAYLTVLVPGDTILGLDLSSGGHLTHGHPINFSGRLFKIEAYGVDRDTERIDYAALLKQAERVRPKLIVAGASAYPRQLDFERFQAIAEQVGAVLVVDMAHIAGLVAAGLHPSPVPCADFVTTTTHKTLRGPRGGMVLCKAQYAEALDKMVMPGLQGGPLMHIIAAKAVALKEAEGPAFRDYQQRIVTNAQELAGELIRLGYKLVSGGTDTHLILISFVGTDLTGKKAEAVLGQAGITVNKNTVPFDPQKPFVTSGIRLGTPALTTRGMGSSEMRQIAGFIDTALKHREEPAVLNRVHADVQALCERFPLYEGRLAAEPVGVV